MSYNLLSKLQESPLYPQNLTKMTFPHLDLKEINIFVISLIILTKYFKFWNDSSPKKNFETILLTNP